jgi:hypothetical protein
MKHYNVLRALKVIIFYLLEDSKVDSSSDEDSVEKLINEEINLTRRGRHLK